MGEIRVKVNLTNLQDETRFRDGGLKKDEIRRFVADALVDTGAVRSVIPNHVLQSLDVGTRGTESADGRKDTVAVSQGILFDIMGRYTIEEALVLGDEVLIGQTVLEKLDLLADCANRRLVPNPDQPVSKVK